MAGPLISFLTSLGSRRVVETVMPERTLADVVLPPQTRRTLDQALAQVRNHTLIFQRWGLGERHTAGRGLAFNFAGPPGTGKTICAEAIAQGISIRGSGMSIKMGAINGSKCVLEEWEKSAVVENIIGYRIANFWQYNVIRVERRG